MGAPAGLVAQDTTTIAGDLVVTGSVTAGSVVDSATPTFTTVTTTGAATVGTNLVMGSATISETDITKIDAITNGTAAASKALVADANVDIAGLRNVTATGTSQAATLKATAALKFETGTNDITFTATGTNVIVTNLPTTDPTVAGALWLDGVTLKLSAGE